MSVSITYSNNPQGSPGWRAERAGRITASRFSDLFSRLKNGSFGAARGNALAQITVERLTGAPVEVYVNEAMRRGTALEPIAREAYEAHTGRKVTQAGFATRVGFPNAGASVDGLVGDEGIIEIKCPWNLEKHLDAILSGAHAEEYRWQIQGCLWITGRRWCDAVSYDDRYPEDMRIAVTRVKRDEDLIATLARDVAEAEAKIQEKIEALRNAIQEPWT